MLTVFFTGNGATISPDLRRRVLHVELFLREARSEDRKINHPLDEQAIEGLRDAILSALWSITLAWDKAGRPPPKLKLKDYEPWSDVVCGILEHAGFASPCTRAPSSASGDRDTEEMEELVDILAARKGELRFAEIVDLCREHSLFARSLARMVKISTVARKTFSAESCRGLTPGFLRQAPSSESNDEAKTCPFFMPNTPPRRGHSDHSGHFYPLYKSYLPSSRRTPLAWRLGTRVIASRQTSASTEPRSQAPLSFHLLLRLLCPSNWLVGESVHYRRGCGNIMASSCVIGSL
jgi:hypothetical protein